MSFPGKRTYAFVPGLQPFSEYRLTVNVFNRKGNGPSSDPVTFNTPEGGEVTRTYDLQHMDAHLKMLDKKRNTEGCFKMLLGLLYKKLTLITVWTL